MRMIVNPTPVPFPRPAVPGRAHPVLGRLLPVVVLLAFAALPREARAEGCEGCEGPTLSYLQQHAGLELERRGDWLNGYARDYLLTDAGECGATLTGPPNVTRETAWLVLRGTGEVWHCPHSKSKDTITVESAQADSTGWSLKVTSGIKLKGPVAEAKLQVEMGRTRGVEIREVTRVSKTVTPGYCRRIKWKGYFEVASFKAEAEFHFTQRWAWWTKNRMTGAKVHAKGSVHMDCGTGTVDLGRQAPIAGYFDLAQGACEASECSWVAPKQLGFFPLLPPYLPEPEDEEPTEVPQAATQDEQDDEEPPPPPPSSDELGEPPSGPLPDPLAD